MHKKPYQTVDDHNGWSRSGMGPAGIPWMVTDHEEFQDEEIDHVHRTADNAADHRRLFDRQAEPVDREGRRHTDEP